MHGVIYFKSIEGFGVILANGLCSFSIAPLAFSPSTRVFAKPQLSWPMWCTAAKRYDKTIQSSV